MSNRSLLAVLLVLAVLQVNADSTPYVRVNQTCTVNQFWNTQACIQCQSNCQCEKYLGCDTLTCPEGQVETSNGDLKYCSTCPTGCTECKAESGVGAFSCQKCGTGYQLIAEICVKQVSEPSITSLPYSVQKTNNQIYGNFGTCTLMDTETSFCTQCDQGYFLNEVNLCEACVDGCIECTSRGTCSKCKDQYFWLPSGKLTQSLEQVKATNQPIYGNSNITIGGGYPYGSGICSDCVDPGAVECTNQGLNSTVCEPAYFLQPSTTEYPRCKACGVTGACLSCKSATECSSCGQGLYLDNGVCKQCFGNTIAPAQTPCLSCNSGKSTSCDSCDTNNLYVKIGTQCVRCAETIPGCQECNTANNQVSCQLCANGLYRVVGSNGVATCSACHDLSTQGVQLCYKDDYSSQPSPIITQCQAGYRLVPKSASDKTLTCAPNVGRTCYTMIDGTTLNCDTCYTSEEIIYQGACTTCLQAIAGCQKCTVSGTTIKCQACINGITDRGNATLNYALDSEQNSCVPCPNVVTAPGVNVCSQCTPDGKCQSCRDGYVISQSVCVACNVANCKICTDTTSACSTCFEGYYEYVQSTTVQCLPCPAGCSKCTTQGDVCTNCYPGFFMSNGGCNQGNVFCADFNEDGSCSTCQYGFRKLDGRCYPCIGFEQGFVCGENAGTECWSQTLGAIAVLLLLAITN